MSNIPESTNTWIQKELSPDKIFHATGFIRDPSLSSKNLISDFSKLLTSGKISGAILNADIIATWKHLYFASVQAIDSFQKGVSIARTLDIELILHIAAERQIKKAFEKVGIQSDTSHCAILLLTPPCKNPELQYHHPIQALFSGDPNPDLLVLSDKKREAIINLYDIPSGSSCSVEADKSHIVNHIINLGALVALEKTWG